MKAVKTGMSALSFFRQLSEFPYRILARQGVNNNGNAWALRRPAAVRARLVAGVVFLAPQPARLVGRPKENDHAMHKSSM